MEQIKFGILRPHVAIGVAATLALAACGGGGGGGSSSAGGGGGGGGATVSVSGVTSKGLLSGAAVSAYAVNADGSRGNLIKSVKSDGSGRYTVTGLPASTLVLFEVTPSADGTTTMRDEATGLDIPLPPSHSFKLRAAATLESTGTTPVQITPFTDMAVKMAEENGGIKPDVVTSANNTVSEFAGVSVLADEPKFDSSGKATNAAAVRLAAVSELAKTGVSDGTTNCAAPGGSASESQVLDAVKCVVDYLSAKGTDTTVTTQLNTALEVAKEDYAAVTDPVELAKVERPLSDQPTELEVIEGAQQTAISEAKKLIQSVRDTVAMADAQTSGSLRTRLQAVYDGAKGLPGPADDGTVEAIKGIAEAIGKAGSATTGFDLLTQRMHTGYVGGSSSPGSGEQYVFRSRCQFYTAGFEAVADTSTPYLGCLILQNVVYGPKQITVSGTDYSYSYTVYEPKYAVYHRVGLVMSSANSYQIFSALVKAPAGPSDTMVFTSLSGGDPQMHQAVITRVGSPGNYTELTLKGSMAPGVHFGWQQGSSGGEEVPVAQGTHQMVDLALKSEAYAGHTRVNMSGTLGVYEGDEQQTLLTLKEGSYVQASTAVAGNIGQLTEEDLSAYRINLIMEGKARTGMTIGGTLVLSDFAHDDERGGPKLGSFEGYMTDNTGVQLFTGAVTLAMPTDSGLGWSAAFEGQLVTSGTNVLTIDLSASQSKTVEGDFSASGSYTQGSNTFMLTVTASKSKPSTNQVVFSTPSGVGFTYIDGAPEVAIKKGEILVGKFTVSSSRLVFADNTYQQF